MIHIKFRTCLFKQFYVRCVFKNASEFQDISVRKFQIDENEKNGGDCL